MLLCTIPITRMDAKGVAMILHKWNSVPTNTPYLCSPILATPRACPGQIYFIKTLSPWKPSLGVVRLQWREKRLDSLDNFQKYPLDGHCAE